MDTMRPVMSECCAAPALPGSQSLNDDDLYIVNLRTRTIVREFGASSPSATVARAGGLPVRPGHALVTGMAARGLGLVS